jgi:hypothetical protein
MDMAKERGEGGGEGVFSVFTTHPHTHTARAFGQSVSFSCTKTTHTLTHIHAHAHAHVQSSKKALSARYNKDFNAACVIKFVEKNPTDLVLKKAMGNRSGSNFKVMGDKGKCVC